MKNPKLKHLLILLALFGLYSHFAQAANTSHAAFEQHCACKMNVPKYNENSNENSKKDDGGKLAIAEFKNPVTDKWTKCKRHLNDIVFSQTETADIDELLKDAEKKGIVCTKKETNDWLDEYRKSAEKYVNFNENQIKENICSKGSDKGKTKRGERTQIKKAKERCLKSLKELVIENEGHRFLADCTSENLKRSQKSNKSVVDLNNTCISNKSAAHIISVHNGNIYDVCKKDEFLFDLNPTRSLEEIESCKNDIIKNSQPKDKRFDQYAKCKNYLNFRGHSKVDDKNKDNTSKAPEVCQRYVLLKIIGGKPTIPNSNKLLVSMQKSGKYTTDLLSLELLHCLKTKNITDCQAYSEFDDQLYAQQIKDRYCLAPEFTSEEEKNQCLNNILTKTDIPEDFDAKQCNNLMNTLKADCIKNAYLKALSEGKEGKHLVVTNCYKSDVFSETAPTDDSTPANEIKPEQGWKDFNPPKVSKKECLEKTKKLYDAYDTCVNNNKPEIQEKAPVSNNVTSETVQAKEVNPNLLKCIKDIEAPDYLKKNYYEKLARSAGINDAKIKECKKDQDQVSCFNNSYYLAKNNISEDGLPLPEEVVAEKSTTKNTPGSNGKVSETEDTNKGKTNDKIKDITVDGSYVDGSTTIIVAGVAGLGTAAVAGGVQRTGGSNLKSDSTVLPTIDSTIPQNEVLGDIKDTNRGWFSFFRDTKMMKKYKHAADKDCREIYHAAKTKVIGTVVATTVVVASGVIAGVMIAKDKEKPQEEQDHHIYLKATGVLVAGSVGAVGAKLIANRSAKTKLEKASIALAQRAQNGPIDCKIQKTAYFDPTQKFITPKELQIAVSNINQATTPLNAILTYQEWNTYLNNGDDQFMNDLEFDISELNTEPGFSEIALEKTKQLLIYSLQTTSNIIFPSAIASEEEEENRPPPINMQQLMPLLQMASQFMESKAGADGSESQAEQKQLDQAEQKVASIDPITDANGGLDDIEVEEVLLEEDKKTTEKNSAIVKEMENNQSS